MADMGKSTPQKLMLRQQKRYILFYTCSVFFKIVNHIQLSECGITKLNIFMNFLQEVESQEVITKVLEGIKRLSGYTENSKSTLTSSDLKRAFQSLGGVEMNLTNSRLMVILVLSFTGFFRSGKLSNLKRSDFILHNTHMSIFIEKNKTDIYRKEH